MTDVRKRNLPKIQQTESPVSDLLRDYERWLAARPSDGKSLEAVLDEYFAEHPMTDEDRAWADRALGLASE